MKFRAASVLVLAICSALGATAACNFGQVPRAVPVDAVSGILDAFRSHHIVALGEGLHGNEQGHALRLALVRDPRFPALVDDIVVEFGNSRYQGMMDRFVGGDDVPHDVLRMEDQYDALVYLGLVSSITMSELSPSLCRDTSYMEMRLGRMALIAPAAPDAAMLKEFCAAHARSPAGR